jgi:hypothetical protein
LSAELVSKIRNRYSEGRPWFMNPDRYEGEVEKRDKDLIRLLKALYRNNKE